MTEPSVLSRQIVLSERAILLIGLGAGAVLRIVQIATSIGSVDAYFWTRHVEFVEKFGVLGAYHVSRVINHPPFALGIALVTKRLGALFGLQLFDSFRILQGVADVVTAFALLAIARRLGRDDGVWIALVFFLSPAAIFISAFHCNSDPLMVMFIVLAILAVVNERPILAGLLIGAACGIKIIAFPVLPLLLFGFRGWKARVQFLVTAAVVGTLIFVPPVVVSGWVAIRNIFLYTGWRGAWGIPLVINVIGFAFPRIVPEDPGGLVTPLLILALLTLWSVEAWRALKREDMDSTRLLHVTGLAFLIVLFLAPGFGIQYLLWLLPYPAFLFRRKAVLILHAVISIFVFWLYTSWAQEWPWVYADGGHNSPWVGMFGLVVWVAIGWAVVTSSRALYRNAPRAA